jgi:hypothetical protein
MLACRALVEDDVRFLAGARLVEAMRTNISADNQRSPFAMRLCTVTTGQTKPEAVSLATASATPGMKVSSSNRSCFRGSNQSTVQIEKHGSAAHVLIVRRTVAQRLPTPQNETICRDEIEPLGAGMVNKSPEECDVIPHNCLALTACECGSAVRCTVVRRVYADLAAST